eukprot:CAMPEP_0117669946 /NCGR_PEP_ID=MMETSP0804-20121206/12440_1 /TAXON_ID=1074897 /ORGANISM="Tetraselmis astigmatica, Strain CCMP880" /LENGTH=573 /DNA_ID=CAMNT_0005478111 /DNA_START=405 /DNA_END=2126 /DNA_ORIENTATION=-
MNLPRKGSIKRTNTQGSISPVGEEDDPAGILACPGTPRCPSPQLGHIDRQTSTNNIVIGRVQQRNEELRLSFGLPINECLIDDWNCAYRSSNNILLQGRLYLFNNFVCFHSNVFGVNKKIIMAAKDIATMRKRKNVGVIPNSMEITCTFRAFFFTSFLNRDEAFWTLCTQWGLCKSQAQQLQSTSSRRLVEVPSRTEADSRRYSIDDSQGDCEEGDNSGEEVGDEGCLRVDWNPRAEGAPAVNSELKEVLREELPCTPNQFFMRFLCNNSGFLKDAMVERGDRDIKVTDWVCHPTLGRVRNVTFVSPVKSAFGPPETRCFQSQRYNIFAGNHLRMETSQIMEDIPYGDHFTVETCWDVAELGPASCQLRVLICVLFSRKTFFRSTIEKATLAEATAGFRAWVAKARQALSDPSPRLQPGHCRSSSWQRCPTPSSPEFSPEKQPLLEQQQPCRKSSEGLNSSVRVSTEMDRPAPSATPASATSWLHAALRSLQTPQGTLLLLLLALASLVAFAVVVRGQGAASAAWQSGARPDEQLQLQMKVLQVEMAQLQEQLAGMVDGLHPYRCPEVTGEEI